MVVIQKSILDFSVHLLYFSHEIYEDRITMFLFLANAFGRHSCIFVLHIVDVQGEEVLKHW